jgi:hypothetical protein
MPGQQLGGLDEVPDGLGPLIVVQMCKRPEDLRQLANWIRGERALQPNEDFGINASTAIDRGVRQLFLQSWGQTQIVSRVFTLRHPSTYGRNRVLPKWCHLGINVPSM